jgi:hypothetical protein
MTLFDTSRSHNTRTQWKDLSLDCKLMFVYHGCMMAMFMTGLFRARTQLAFTGILAAVLVSLSLRNRRAYNWEWPGAGAKEVVAALGVLILCALFDLSAIPSFPPSDPRFLPWHLAGLGLAAFGFLAALKVIQTTQVEFLSHCERPGFEHPVGIPPSLTPVVPDDPLWKSIVRRGYFVVGAATWAGFIFSFYLSGVAMRDGTTRPDRTHTEPLVDHGQVVYIPHSQKALLDLLDGLTEIGIPAIILGGLGLNFFGGIKIFNNVPTLKEWKQSRSKGRSIS